MRAPPLSKLSRMVIIIMLKEQMALPTMTGFRRPIWSRKRAGTIMPRANARLMRPPRIWARFDVRPTLFSRTVVM